MSLFGTTHFFFVSGTKTNWKAAYTGALLNFNTKLFIACMATEVVCRRSSPISWTLKNDVCETVLVHTSREQTKRSPSISESKIPGSIPLSIRVESTLVMNQGREVKLLVFKFFRLLTHELCRLGTKCAKCPTAPLMRPSMVQSN